MGYLPAVRGEGEGVVAQLVEGEVRPREQSLQPRRRTSLGRLLRRLLTLLVLEQGRRLLLGDARELDLDLAQQVLERLEPAIRLRALAQGAVGSRSCGGEWLTARRTSGSPHGAEWFITRRGVAHHTAGRPGLAAFHWARWRGGPTARTPPWVARRGGSRDAGRIAPPDGPRAAPVPGGRGGPALAKCRNGALLSARSAASPSASRANMKVRSPKRSKGTYTAAAVSAVAGAPRGVEPGGRPSEGRPAAVAPGIGPNSQNFRVCARSWRR